MRDEQLQDGNFELEVRVYKLVDGTDLSPEQIPLYETTVSLQDAPGYDIHTSMRRLAYGADEAIQTFRQKYCYHNAPAPEGFCDNCGKDINDKLN